MECSSREGWANHSSGDDELNMNRNIVSVFCLGFVFITSSAACQENAYSNETSSLPSHLIFIEAGGHGLASINFEQYLSEHIGVRVGYGIYIPLLLNFYFGNERLFEVGAGAMYSPYAYFEPFVSKERTLLFGCTIGHKFQPSIGGLTLRYSFTPMFNPSNGKLLPMFGLSLGLAF